jgi:hypothetical protein
VEIAKFAGFNSPQLAAGKFILSGMTCSIYKYDNIKETKGVIENWRKEDNTVRPYNSLNPVVA